MSVIHWPSIVEYNDYELSLLKKEKENNFINLSSFNKIFIKAQTDGSTRFC